MSFAESLNFTNGGREVQLKVQAGKQLIFTSVRLGDGTMTGTISAKTALINERASVNVNTVSVNSDYATIDAIFKNADLSSGFYWKELGVFVANPDNPNDRNADILYAYQNVGELAEYIPAPSSASIEKIIHIPIFVGDVNNVSISVNSIIQQEATITQPEESSLDAGDYFSFYDTSDAKNKRIKLSDLKKHTTTFVEISPDFWSVLEGNTGSITIEDLYVCKQNKVINGFILMSAESADWHTSDHIYTLPTKYVPICTDVVVPVICYDAEGKMVNGESQALAEIIGDKLYIHLGSQVNFFYLKMSFCYICEEE